MEGMANLNDEQKEWVKIQRYMVEAEVQVECKRHEGFRIKFFDFVEHQRSDYFISIVIVLNTVLMCIDYSDASKTYKKVRRE